MRHGSRAEFFAPGDTVAPAMVSGGSRAGASISNGYAMEHLRYAPPGDELIQLHELGRGADAGRADYAALFHHRFHFT
jgi:hypothetical protein